MNNTQETPTFSDSALQKAVKELSPKIDSYHKSLDKISADIKSLETYLQKNGIGLDKSVGIGTYHEKEYSLRWEHWEPENKHRLTVAIYKDTGEKDENGWPEFKEENAYPLIECPAGIRIWANEYLPSLVKEIKEAVVEMGKAKTQE